MLCSLAMTKFKVELAISQRLAETATQRIKYFMKGSLMTTNNKFMLSMATIAILSGASVALGADVDINNAALKGKGDSSGVFTADVSGATADSDKVTITSKIDKTGDTKDMTKLVISTDKAFEIGTANQSSGVVSIGGTANAADNG